jgi:polyphosphate kinase
MNERVLQEAADKSNPLIERMRFLGIYSNNLDEFYNFLAHYNSHSGSLTSLFHYGELCH